MRTRQSYSEPIQEPSLSEPINDRLALELNPYVLQGRPHVRKSKLSCRYDSERKERAGLRGLFNVGVLEIGDIAGDDSRSRFGFGDHLPLFLVTGDQHLSLNAKLAESLALFAAPRELSLLCGSSSTSEDHLGSWGVSWRIIVIFLPFDAGSHGN